MRTLSTFILLAGLVFTFLPACTKTPQKRPGSEYEGSARWGYELAESDIRRFSADARLYSIIGSDVYKDGRLPAKKGTWKYLAWSPSLQKELTVTVKYDGSVNVRQKSGEEPPSAGGQPVPTGWINSPQVFSGISAYIGVKHTTADLVEFNHRRYPVAAGAAVWDIHFIGKNKFVVRWDGEYLGEFSPDH